ncbi:MAG: dockerin type I repeat-containing protein, partial [Prevotellaceae bacterium]|nr:dockerin type I repeat-containing protein [Candidatus Colivivens caballi]
MKQKLLLLAVSLLMCAVSFAQWVKPVPEAVPFHEGSQTDYSYLYNKDAGAFFTEGNDWGTRASITTTGALKVYFSKYTVDGEEWNGKTYLFNDSTIAKKSWNIVFIDNEAGACYCDHGSQPNFMWDIIVAADGSFRLTCSELNPTYKPGLYPDCYFGYDLGTAPATILNGLLSTDADAPENIAIDWQLVSQEAYDAYLSEVTVYEAAMKLSQLIEEAKGYGLDVTDEENVFADTNSSLEALNDAIASVTSKINAYKEAAATPEDPQDVTASFFDVWDFENGIGSWVSTTGAQNNQTGGTAGKMEDTTNFWENWNPNVFSGKMHYTIKDMPNGVYQFGLSVGLQGGEGYIYANDTKKYVDYVNIRPGSVIAMVDSNTMDCGLEIIKNSTQWVGVDDAQLLYMGNGIGSYQFWIDAIVDNAPDFEDSDVYTQKSLLEWYLGILAEAKAKTTAEDIIAYIPTFLAALDTITANYNAYEEYRKVVDEVAEALGTEELYGDAADELTDYLLTYEEEILEAGLMSTEEILAEAQRIRDLIAKARKESVKEGGDVTSLIVNNNFDNKLTGWSHDPKYADGSWGGLCDAALDNFNPCVERWNDNFDFYQDIVVPTGVYELKAQGFNRPNDNTVTSFTDYMNNPDDNSAICAYIYANDKQAKIKSIGAHHYTENLASNCSSTEWEGSTVYIPNGMTSASAAFSLGDYDNSVYGLVTGDSLRIGIRSIDGTETGRWTLWDNFRLTYWGKNADKLTELLSELIEENEALLAEEKPMSEADKQALQNTIDDAYSAITVGDGNTMFDAYVAMTEASKNAKECIQAYADLADALVELEGAIETYAETAREDALDDAATLIEEISEALENGTYSLDEAKAKIEAVGTAMVALTLPKEKVTDENPADMSSVIVNATFDVIGDFTGWTGSGFGAGGTTAACAERYNMAFDTYQDITGLPAGTYKVGVDGFYRRGTSSNDYDIESAQGSNAKRHAFIYAETSEGSYSNRIYAISAGAVASTESFGGATAKYGSDKVIPNTMAAAVNWFENGMYKDNNIIVKVGEDGKLRIGVKKSEKISEDWSIFDTFTLTYYGDESAKKVSGDPYNSIAGDADENGEINGADISVIASYILGDEPEPFDAAAADFDGNEEINVNDISGVANFILYGNEEGSKAKTILAAEVNSATLTLSADDIVAG